MIETKTGLVSNQASKQEIDAAISYPGRLGFESAFMYMSEQLFNAFYWYLYVYQWQDPTVREPLRVRFVDGIELTDISPTNAASYALQYVLAPLMTRKEWDHAVSAQHPSGFYQTYRRLFPGDDPLDTSNVIPLSSTPPSDLLKLPFSASDTWYFYQGPHDWNGCCGDDCPGAPSSSIDLGPGTNCWDSIPTDRWITAAAAGTAYVSCGGCMVRVVHSDGWETRYYHVANTIGNGTSVSKDAHLGNPSCKPTYGGDCGGCGGSAQGKHHVHFAIYQSGAYQPIDGTSLEGWIVHATGCYAGYLQKGSDYVYEGGQVSSQSGGPDTTPPDTSITSGPSGLINYRDVTFAWSANESNVTYSYKLEGYDSGWSGWTSNTSKTYYGLGDNSYTFKVKAKDQAGNEDPSPAERGFTIDGTAPSNPTSIWSTSHSRWSWSRDNTIEVCWSGASDGDGSGVDGYSYEWSTSSTTIPDTSKDVEESTNCVTSSSLSDSNNWYFHIRTRDNAGNWNGSATHYGPFWIDTTGPDISWSGAAPNQWYNSDQIVEWMLSDNRSGVAGFRQRWDNEDYSSFLPYSSGYLMLSWGGEGQRRAYVKAKDNAGNEREHNRGWFGYDVTPPTNPSITMNGGAQYTNDPNVTLSLSASDSHSGVADMRLHNEGTGWSDWQSYATSKSWTLTAGDGTKTVTVQFRDAAGNESGTASDDIILDTTPPDTTITSGPQGDIPTGGATFTWTGSDNITPTGNLVYSYRLRGLSDNWSAWAGGTSVNYSALSDGEYTFEVKARDLATNEDATPASRSFFVDTTPPDTTITSGPSGCIGTADVTFTWTGSDNRTPTADLLYSHKLEGFDADWSPWTGDTSKSYTSLPDGDYTFKVKAKDGVGHEDPTPAARSFRVDTTPPTGSVLINGGDSTTNKIAVHLDISGDDGPVGCGVIEMRLSNDGFNWEAWEPFATEGNWLLPTLNRTTWTVHLQLKDLVGNVSEAFTDDIYLDLYPPRPSSENYQLGARVVASGDPTSISESYGLLSATMGQPLADGRRQGVTYRLESGYQGAWPSVPRGRPPAESYDINAGLLASSGGYQASESYRLQSAMGQPTDVGPRSSENYQLLSGYLPCKLFGDLDINGRVDVVDVQQVASKWRCRLEDDCYHERYDLDKDGDIDVVDIMLVVKHWGETCS